MDIFNGPIGRQRFACTIILIFFNSLNLVIFILRFLGIHKQLNPNIHGTHRSRSYIVVHFDAQID